MRRGHAPDGDAAELARGAEAERDHLRLVAAGRGNSRRKPAVHLAAHEEFCLLGDDDLLGVRARRVRDIKFRRAAFAGIGGRGMRLAEMVDMGVAEQDAVDLAEPRIIGTAHRASCVVENSRPVGILEDQRPVGRTELSVMAAERRDLHTGRKGRLNGQAHQAAQDNYKHSHNQTHARHHFHPSFSDDSVTRSLQQAGAANGAPIRRETPSIKRAGKNRTKTREALALEALASDNVAT